mmetsp:Transcript_8389/g.23983  ORF Transcript_8389/g.23983 Transcript_8389/m.23983 type:complete len:124 (+) Transcript_8389:169-540(+)
MSTTELTGTQACPKAEEATAPGTSRSTARTSAQLSACCAGPKAPAPSRRRTYLALVGSDGRDERGAQAAVGASPRRERLGDGGLRAPSHGEVRSEKSEDGRCGPHRAAHGTRRPRDVAPHGSV